MFFPLSHICSLLSSSLPPILHPLPVSSVFLTSLQLLSCILLLHTSRCWSSDATTLWSAWHWASCLGVDKGNRIFLLLGSLRLMTKCSCCPKRLFQGLKRLKNTVGSHWAAPETCLFPSEVSPFQNPTNPSTWLRGARCAFGRMCIWFCARYLGTVKIWFIYHKEWSV